MNSNKILTLCAALTLVAACDGGSGDAGDGYTTDNMDGTTDAMDETATGDGDSGDGDSGDGDTGDTGIDIDPDNMIDNFEDGDGALIPNGGRQGYWYTFNDETEGATQTPATDMVLPVEGGAAGTSMALQTTGSGFAEWGAGIGIDLNNAGGGMDGGNGIKEIYDSSAYTGIVVHAKGNGQVRAMVQIEATIPPEEGGTCMADCDPHGKVLLLSDEWQQFTLEFGTLNQEGWGTPAEWDASKVVGVQFKVSANQDFDFWVDEIGFY